MTSVGASATGRNAYFVIVAWMGVDISNGPAFVAILLAAGSVAEFLTTNLGGIIADRYERKLVCLVCDGLRMILIALTILGLCLLNPLAVLTVSCAHRHRHRSVRNPEPIRAFATSPAPNDGDADRQ